MHCAIARIQAGKFHSNLNLSQKLAITKQTVRSEHFSLKKSFYQGFLTFSTIGCADDLFYTLIGFENTPASGKLMEWVIVLEGSSIKQNQSLIGNVFKMDPRLKKLRIQTGVVKRCGKEKLSYRKEADMQKDKIEKMETEGKDEADIKKMTEVIW